MKTSLRLSAAVGLAVLAGVASAQTRLTILHNNDGESKLINPGSTLADFGGAARFVTLVNDLRTQAQSEGKVVMLSSGDNFLAGPEFNASLNLPAGVPFYDAVAMDRAFYDAICIGNHEFDFGPGVLARFVSSFSASGPFLSANLNFSQEPALQALVNSGDIAPSTIIDLGGGVRVGVIGATTPQLPSISSPGLVQVDPNVAGAINAQVALLQAQNVDKIIVVSHLQSLTEDLALIPNLSGVDVVIAGGGDELLANPGQLLVPGDTVLDAYPLVRTDAQGRSVRVITTKGGYRYVGRLIVDFDAAGEIVAVDTRSGPVRVSGVAPDAVAPEAFTQANVVDPVAASIAAQAANVIATSQVPLDGRRNSIRRVETNLGNLVADTLLWEATRQAPAFNAPVPEIAIQNGGGIRNDNIIPAGNFTELNTFQIVPFANFVTIIPNVPPATVKAVLENAISRDKPQPGFPTSGDGRFAQVAGMTFEYEVGNRPGSRIKRVVLDNGTVLVDNFAVVPGAPAIDVATLDFLATGGDEYPLNGLPFTRLGVLQQRALFSYVQIPLAGVISAADYPVGGEGRIVRNDRCAGDADNNFIVDFRDLNRVLSNFGQSGTNIPGDINRDGVVNMIDLNLVLNTFGGDCR